MTECEKLSDRHLAAATIMGPFLRSEGASIGLSSSSEDRLSSTINTGCFFKGQRIFNSFYKPLRTLGAVCIIVMLFSTMLPLTRAAWQDNIRPKRFVQLGKCMMLLYLEYFVCLYNLVGYIPVQ